MLVLSRRRDQEVSLPGLGVKFKVLQVKGNSVRLGFEAPENVRVLRSELNEFDNEFELELDEGNFEPNSIEFKTTTNLSIAS